MKPLSVEQLKELNVGDWVWVEDKERCEQFYARKDSECEIQIYGKNADNEFAYTTADEFGACDYCDYGKTWLAYKNKEQAEAKGEMASCKCKYVKNGKCTNPSAEAIDCPTEVYDKYSCYSDCDWFEAERRLAEPKGE